MVQGTGSETGKTTLVAGLCRLFANAGLRVAPFKAQNMSLNCFVTEEGGEIARATAVQAFGARERPIVHMNPLLLKPKSDELSQLIVHGRAVGDVTAHEFFGSNRLRDLKRSAIEHSINFLEQQFDVIIAEGAGSCAEPNLREFDAVNMGIAEFLDADVYIVTDLDKGGCFASILGSLRIMELTAPSDIRRIRGFILNKFRGDRALLQPAIEFLERHTGIPVVGVVPWLFDLTLSEEDRLKERLCPHPEIDIAVLYLPHIANVSDFDPLRAEENVQLRFVKSPAEMGHPDAIIIPGTKNTVWDLEFLRRTGMIATLERSVGSVPLMGICGGYQMLGRELRDPDRLESEIGTIPGLDLLDISFRFGAAKVVTNRCYQPTQANPFSSAGAVSGYEIRAGIPERGCCAPLYTYGDGEDGGVDAEKMIMGTSIHDIFQNARFSREVINHLRARKGLLRLQSPLRNNQSAMDATYERLAMTLKESTNFAQDRRR
jgi:adenosylcobyric acid synthase